MKERKNAGCLKNRVTASWIILVFMVGTFLSGCGKGVEVVYYENSNIPTFTCVTGIEQKKKESSNGLNIYYYDGYTNDLDEYVEYLKENGFAEVAVEDGYDYLKTLAKDSSTRVLVDYHEAEKGQVGIMPYKN